jgi:hypothetical protein
LTARSVTVAEVDAETIPEASAILEGHFAPFLKRFG